jgi:hypothetical protein
VSAPVSHVAHQILGMSSGPNAVTAKHAAIVASASGATEIVAAVAGKRIVVLAYNYMSAGTVNAKWQSGASDLTGLAYMVANTGKVAGFNPAGWCKTTAGAALNINLSGNVAIGGEITYAEID